MSSEVNEMEHVEGTEFRNKRTGEIGVMGPILPNNDSRFWAYYKHPCVYEMVASLAYLRDNYELVKEPTHE